MEVGDKVELIFTTYNIDLHIGDIGTIVISIPYHHQYGVDWGKPISNGHACNGYGLDGRCWFVLEDYIRKVSSYENVLI